LLSWEHAYCFANFDLLQVALDLAGLVQGNGSVNASTQLRVGMRMSEKKLRSRV